MWIIIWETFLCEHSIPVQFIFESAKKGLIWFRWNVHQICSDVQCGILNFPLKCPLPILLLAHLAWWHFGHERHRVPSLNVPPVNHSVSIVTTINLRIVFRSHQIFKNLLQTQSPPHRLKHANIYIIAFCCHSSKFHSHIMIKMCQQQACQYYLMLACLLDIAHFSCNLDTVLTSDDGLHQGHHMRNSHICGVHLQFKWAGPWENVS